jgi:hypothetical protein
MKVRASYLASAQPAGAAPTYSRDRSRVGSAYMVAIGSGLALGGTLGTVMFATKGNWCSYHERPDGSLALGLSLIGAGTVLATAGAIRLATRGPGNQLRGVRLIGPIASSIVASALAGVSPLFLPGSYRCI